MLNLEKLFKGKTLKEVNNLIEANFGFRYEEINHPDYFADEDTGLWPTMLIGTVDDMGLNASCVVFNSNGLFDYLTD